MPDHPALQPDLREILDASERLFSALDAFEMNARINAINAIRVRLAKHSPFRDEPVDCVRWVPADQVEANDYNPNSVAPPEMKLLAHSIGEDGYTQPIVAWSNEGKYTVIDGFHRHRVGKEVPAVAERVHGHLPLAVINEGRTDRSDRIASTIRHNRARGKHKVEAMSEIVIELKRRNWSDDKIGRELGMDPDEVLRLCQITGLAEVFKSHEFSKSWEVGDAAVLPDIDEDEIEAIGDAEDGRILHTFDKWECHAHNFYGSTPPDGMTAAQAEYQYRLLLADSSLFSAALEVVIRDWKHSCEHYLTNEKMNRIAWLGQTALAQAHRIPASFRGGYSLLTPEQQKKADEVALEYLNKWLVANGRPAVDMAAARSKVNAELY
jgi:ParB-like chromosome segregation protein Spo0J